MKNEVPKRKLPRGNPHIFCKQKMFRNLRYLFRNSTRRNQYANHMVSTVVSHSHKSSYSRMTAPAFIAIGLFLNLGIADSAATEESSTHPTLKLNRHSRNFIADAAEIVSPAVVNIVTKVMMGQSSGSGFIVSRHGFVVTNAHVVANSQDGKVLVTFWDGRRKIGVVHATDKVSDIAVVKLLDIEGEVIPVAKLGSSASLRVGEFVVALGSPLHLQNTVTFGIVSATARHASELGLAKNRSEYIQTDAAINVGNSGGPLVNLEGEVIGINTMKLDNSAGISFSIPIDSAGVIIKQLIKNKRVVRPYIGLHMAPCVNGQRQKLRRGSAELLPEEASIVVVDVDSQSPASSAGLRVGDVIEFVDGRPVRSVRDLYYAIGLDVGKAVEFKVRRNGDLLSFVVVSASEQ